MSTASPSIGSLLRRRGAIRTNDNTHPVLAWLTRYSPSQGWATLVILLLTLLVVADSINVAGWVDSDGLTAALVWSALVGLVLGEGSRAVVRADTGWDSQSARSPSSGRRRRLSKPTRCPPGSPTATTGWQSGGKRRRREG